MGWRLVYNENREVYAILNAQLSYDNALDIATLITNLTGKLLDLEKRNARGQWTMYA